MKFDVVTLFPGMFLGPLEDGMLARARRAGLLGVRLHDLRRWGVGSHRQVDDASYGGGRGMVLRPEPLFEAVEWIRGRYPSPDDRVVMMSPQGRAFDPVAARRLAGHDRVVLLCGRYEGVDERVVEELADEEIRVGDAVHTGGELPALAVIDGVARFLPGVLGDEEAASDDSFEAGSLEFPQYTRPQSYRGLEVPEVLLSGDHGGIRSWRRAKALEATRRKRPDLLENAGFRTAPSRRDQGE